MQTQSHQPLPRIDNRPVVQHGSEAHYHRLRTAPRHPDAAYTIPDRTNHRWCFDIILLLATIATLVVIF